MNMTVYDFIQSYKQKGGRAIFRIAEEEDNTINYMRIEPDEIEAFLFTLNPSLIVNHWYVSYFNISKLDINGIPYEGIEVVVTIVV